MTEVKLKPPGQQENLLELVNRCIEERRVRQTFHAVQRGKQRKINLPGMLYVLKNGYHEKRKTSFDEVFNRWKYAIRGMTVDSLDARVIISFDERGMIIITAIILTGRKNEKH